ncbi:ASCH domain-containing protein [Tropicimonas isoalkanivorans]|uniref:ASCH domain-containing protein n=1 Tax=Tropicimonas isoalkanivorans TaxID=441112 RepID=A0A1I1FNM9_9RHOB|nr:ASCH domain-containing protein [Tropicimonas isoalkanivorans]SFC01027.1 ASCH domain-containing protein [Tropicimonas isoalkanivorans]
MNIEKALIVDEPWISKILSGAKTWEMRSTSAKQRGWIGLIKKGSGHVVGVAKMTGVDGPLSDQKMIDNSDKHHIPSDIFLAGKFSKHRYAWIMSGAVRLRRPVPYRHKSGAVIWVALDQNVSDALAQDEAVKALA